MFKCAGGCGGNVARDEVFCKGCKWIMTQQYQHEITNSLRIATVANTINVGSPKAEPILNANANATKRQPKVGYTTNPYFQMAVS